MKSDNNYFTFLGNRYLGTWETAYQAYELSKEYPTFSDYLKENYQPLTDYKEFMGSMEKDFLTARLKANGFNIQKTAKEIGVNRENLYTKIVNLKIEIPGRQINYSAYTPKNK